MRPVAVCVLSLYSMNAPTRTIVSETVRELSVYHPSEHYIGTVLYL